ncbi:chondroitinase family polysaccharide lyase [Pedobacter nyackensis]|uniref:chondroitinase family polysaccharide lyase n=1 Tax=Pedobacter nyackensis TaxID=475255 RepID=UPI00292DC1DB|nr:chondroitinase family polysaccharide lyase [Pedobacter nyackensis]
MSRLLYLILLICVQSNVSFAQMQTDICENDVPNDWNAVNGKLSLTGTHFKLGKQAVKWNWTAGNKSLIKVENNAFKTVASNPRSTFVVWIYNEVPVNDKLKFTFGDGKQNACNFEFNLNFKGWRTAWVMYHRDMAGKPTKEMKIMQVQAPASVKKGTLFIDQLMYDVTINPRSPMRDEQVPFVNPEADKAANAHWNSLYAFNRTPHFLQLRMQLKASDLADISKINMRYEDVAFAVKKEISAEKLKDIKMEFTSWNIARKANQITGRPVYSINDTELVTLTPTEGLKDRNQLSGVKRYTQLMLQVAQVFHSSSDQLVRSTFETMFIDLLDHFEDQGWSYGSGMGALHHHGYNLQGYYTSCLIMRDAIKRHGKLERTFKSMSWFSGLGRTLQLPQRLPSSNIDVFNTLLGSMLSAILIMDDTPEKLRYLQSYSKWLSKNIAADHTIEGAFKPDGAVFHHANIYPAYGIGGFNGVAPILYVLSGTGFKVEQAAHESFKNSLVMMHYYTNPYKWPISVAGRHPTGTWRIADVPFAYMAMAGSPDGISKIDTTMAGIYLKLNEDKKNKWINLFKNMGIKPAGYTNGHWNMNYGLLDIHRRQDWLLTVRGHNRYFISHESYPGANMYGRYLSYGHLEVLFPETTTDDGSNFKDEGWDWNNIPGTTTIHLPLNKLRAEIVNPDDFSGSEEMLITDEPYAGGTTLAQQGMFAMKLHGHDKYDMGSFRATKSWFMFDSLIVCLGSDIKNNLNEYPTETTLFQNYLKTPADVFSINGQVSKQFPFSTNGIPGKPLTVIDNRNIGYYIPDGEKVSFTKSTQVSRDQKDSRNTTGNFAKLVFQHGKAPTNESYEYAMLIKTDQKGIEKVATAMKSKQPLYKVLQKDATAHIVWYGAEQLTALAVFGSHVKTTDSLLMDNNKPCLLMYKKEEKTLKLSVTDPDLAFYEGPDDSPLTVDGKRKEVSIYSRNWYRSPSKPSVVKLLIKGNWTPGNENEEIKAELQPGGNTLITVHCADGLTSKIELLERK